jgi:GDP-4-dehydro-6-deoxy-D-mannose reductase
MICLVTGSNGFAASHLIEHLLDLGHDVLGTYRIRSDLANLKDIPPTDKLTLTPMDLHDPFGVENVIKDFKPDLVFHLAAQSFVGWSWSHPKETIETNVNGTLYLLEAIRKHAPLARVHIASSSQVYGKECPRDGMGKNTLFSPMNPYDTSKLSQEMLGLQYFNSYGLKVVRTRAFNISGPRRGESFAESSWAKQIAQIEIYGPGTIDHGNLESFRDYVDVRDVVRCYAKACFEGDPGELYILGSGNPQKMDDVLNLLISLSVVKITKSEDPARMRPSDTPFMKSKNSVLQKWVEHPISFQKTMSDLLNYWRGRVKRNDFTSLR